MQRIVSKGAGIHPPFAKRFCFLVSSLGAYFEHLQVSISNASPGKTASGEGKILRVAKASYANVAIS